MANVPRLLSVLVLLAVLLIPKSDGVNGKRKLSDYVEHFETLSYSSSHVDDQHRRHKRSAASDDHKVRLDFVSHGRRFAVELKRDHSVFHNDLVVERGDRESSDYDTSHIYEGSLMGDPDSHCFGAIRDGVFDGQIHTREGTFYVERANRYFPNDLTDKNDSFHSVIYHEKHLVDPYHHSRQAGLGLQRPGCGNSHSVQSWMDQVQQRGESSQPPTNPDEEEDVEEELQFPDANDDPSFKYTEEGNSRVKRSLPNTNNRKSCSLYIQTDPLFWRHVKEQENDPAKTEEEILSLIAQHVKAVNRIYSDTSFDGKYKHNGYQFEVQRIKIHNDSQCTGLNNVGLSSSSSNSKKDYTSSQLLASDEKNPFCIPNVDVSNFLNLHSKSDHEAFCLAYVFTYRDFTGGTLGLAWVASASGASGGICETYKRYTENIKGVHHTAKRSLNTGIITFVNYNSRVPPKVSQLTLAHEIGHNFGSPHDYPNECRPGGKTGNFIMFASATSGDRDNNNKFSYCSKSNISAVLDAITDGRKRNCFTESDGAFCGNKIVEDGEECDCGFDEHECAEQCCYPRKTENKANRCKRKAGAECSPSEGPCCDHKCQFTPMWEKVKCKSEDECTAPAVCNGTIAKCPDPSPKPDKTECNDGTQVCQKGECKDSICLKYGLVSCFLTSETVSDKRQLCELACQRPGNNNTCMSTADLASSGLIRNLTDGLSLRPGSPCDNFQGYCDVFLKCRKVDAEGPLVRLKNLVFNEETLLNIAQWVTDNWWAVLLACIAFVIFMGICIKCCSIHTPSSNPRLPKNLHFTETLRRPVRSLQQKHYRPANGAHEAPPPYPGRGGPGHGYGEGRGHYNRSSHPADLNQHNMGLAGQQPQPQQQQRRQGGDRRSGQRGSRIEMQPMR